MTNVVITDHWSHSPQSLSIITMIKILLILMTMKTVMTQMTPLTQVIDIFRDRLQVAGCRAGCVDTYDDERLGQCWTVCHVVSADSSTWSRVCRVCDDTCLTGCRLFSETRLNIDLEQTLEVEVVRDKIVMMNNTGVMLVTSRDEAGHWYELGQTHDTVLETLVNMVETFVIRVSVTGEVNIARVDTDNEDDEDHWELFLESVVPDQELFEVIVYWSEPGQFTVRWSIDDNIVGVILTNNTRVMLSAPALSRVTVQVTETVTGLTSDTLTVSTPDTSHDDSVSMESSHVSLIIAIIFMISLIIILVIVINIFKKTKSMCSSGKSEHSFLSSGPDKSIISFDTFVKQNKIIVPERGSSLSVNVDLYVI